MYSIIKCNQTVIVDRIELLNISINNVNNIKLMFVSFPVKRNLYW